MSHVLDFEYENTEQFKWHFYFSMAKANDSRSLSNIFIPCGRTTGGKLNIPVDGLYSW